MGKSPKSRRSTAALALTAASALIVATEAATEAPATPDDTLVLSTSPAPRSIRSLILTSLQAGEATAVIAAKVQASFPGSKAAVKASTHISWYRGRLKKAGRLPQAVTTNS